MEIWSTERRTLLVMREADGEAEEGWKGMLGSGEASCQDSSSGGRLKYEGGWLIRGETVVL